MVGHLVVGDIEVDEPVAVEVVGDRAQRSAGFDRVGAQAGTDGGVDEGPVAEVAQEPVGFGRLAQWPAVVGLPAGQETALSVGAVEAVIVADVQVEPAVGVVVEEDGRHAEPAVVDSGGLRGVLEGPVSVQGTAPEVTEEPVRAQVRQVEVDPAVPVVVGRGDSDVVARLVESNLGRDIGEAEFSGLGETVPEQAVGRLDRRRRKDGLPVLVAVEGASLPQVDVEIAVVVVVEEGDSGAHHFGGVELSGHAVEVDEVDPYVGADFHECRRGVLRASGRRGEGGDERQYDRHGWAGIIRPAPFQ